MKEDVYLSNEGTFIMANLRKKKNYAFSREELAEAIWTRDRKKWPSNWKGLFYCGMSCAKKYLEVHYDESIRHYRGGAWKLAYTPVDLEVATKQSVVRGGHHLSSANRKGKILNRLIQTLDTLPGLDRKEAESLRDGIIRAVEQVYAADGQLARAIESGELASIESEETREGENLDNKEVK